MKVTGGLFLVSLFCVVLGEVIPKNGFYDYHRRIGMYQAAKLKKLETDISPAARVAGGGTTTTLSVPYQAGLIITFRIILQSVCGGTIISDTRILTAAHCNNDGVSIANSITVVAGSNFLWTGGQRLQVSGVATYPGYNPHIFANDVAVLVVPSISFGTFVQPINLPSGSELNLNFVGTTGLASGFGITRDGDTVGLTQMISSVNLQVISNAECQSIYGGSINLQNSHLCTSGAGGVGMCPGDTGGPLVATVNWRRIIIGIGSFTASNGCQAGFPTGFSRVTSFTNWILSV